MASIKQTVLSPLSAPVTRSNSLALISFNGLFADGPHVPPLALLALFPIAAAKGFTCHIIDVAALVRAGKVNIRDDIPLQVATLLQRKAELLCFSTRCDTYHLCVQTSALVKKKCKNAFIIFGGPHASATDFDTLQSFKHIDLIVRGEGEKTFAEFLDFWLMNKSIKFLLGTTSRVDDRGIQKNPDRPLIDDLKDLAFPAYEAWANEYGDINFRFSEVEIGRGCPFNCNFCFTTKMWRRKYRVKPVEFLLKEMLFLQSNFGENSFHFIHDNLILLDNAYIEELVDKLSSSRRVALWNTSTRIDTLDIKLLPMLRSAGLSTLFFGIETGNNEMKGTLNKNFPLKRCLNLLKSLDTSNIASIFSFIVGFPGESQHSIEETIEFAAYCAASSQSCTVQIHAFALEAGTELFDQHFSEIEYSGPKADHVKQRVTLSSDAEFLLKSNPRIFSTFYGVYLDKEKRNLPYALQDIATMLIRVYPLTIGYALFKKLITPTLIVSTCSAEFDSWEENETSFEKKLQRLAEIASDLIAEIEIFDSLVSKLKKLESVFVLSDGCMRDQYFDSKMPLQEFSGADSRCKVYLNRADIDGRYLSRLLSESIADDKSPEDDSWRICCRPTEYLIAINHKDKSIFRWQLNRSQRALLSTLSSSPDVGLAIDVALESTIRLQGITDLNRGVIRENLLSWVAELQSAGVLGLLQGSAELI